MRLLITIGTGGQHCVVLHRDFDNKGEKIKIDDYGANIVAAVLLWKSFSRNKSKDSICTHSFVLSMLPFILAPCL